MKCVYGHVSADGTAEWQGRSADGQVITQSEVWGIISEAKKNQEISQKPAFEGIGAQIEKRLKGADLYGIDLSGQDLTDFDLSDVKLTFENLSNAKLIRSKLSYTNLNYANLAEADLSDANIDHVNTRYLRAHSVIFNQAQIVDTTFENAILSEASFHRTSMRSIGLRNVLIDNALFEPTNFSLSDPMAALSRHNRALRLTGCRPW